MYASEAIWNYNLHKWFNTKDSLYTCAWLAKCIPYILITEIIYFWQPNLQNSHENKCYYAVLFSSHTLLVNMWTAGCYHLNFYLVNLAIMLIYIF